MPRKKKGKRAIGDLIRGAREDKPRKVPARDGNRMPPPSVGAATGEAGAARDPEPAPASCVVDVDPARRLLFGWSLRRFLDARPPSTVVQLSRDDTVGGAMAKLARHGILSAPVVDERNLVFHGYARAREPRRNHAPGASTRPRREIGRVFFFSSRGFFSCPPRACASRLAPRPSLISCPLPRLRFLSCLDILHAFLDGIDPSLARSSYAARLPRESRMEELDAVAEEFLAAPLSKVRTSPDGKLVYRGHGDDATMLDVVSHGFFHKPSRGSRSTAKTGESENDAPRGKLEGEARTSPDEKLVAPSAFGSPMTPPLPRAPPGAASVVPLRHEHEAIVAHPPPLTIAQRERQADEDHRLRREAEREAPPGERNGASRSGGLRTQDVDSLEAGGSRRSQPPDFEAAKAIEAEAFGALAESTATPRVRTLGVCHRLAVFENDEANDAMRIVAVASQLDVVRFLHRRVDALGAVAEATIDELGLASFGESSSSGGVVTAPWDASALECFATMRARGVSAVGVVDQAGELVANLSASDLRRLDARSFRLLALPVAEFISRRKGDAIGRRGAPFAEARKLERAREVDERRAETLKAGMGAEKSDEEAPKSAGDGRRGDGNGGSAEVPISSSDEDSDRATVSAAARERRDKRALQKGEAKRAEGVDEGGYSSGSSSGGADLRRPPLPESSRTFVELVFARGDTTLRRVLHLMTAHAIHHVYVVDDEDKPRAVVTPTDILRLFVVDDEESPWRERWGGGPPAEDAAEARGEGRGTEKTPPTYGGAEGVVV